MHGDREAGMSDVDEQRAALEDLIEQRNAKVRAAAVLDAQIADLDRQIAAIEASR